MKLHFLPETRTKTATNWTRTGLETSRNLESPGYALLSRGTNIECCGPVLGDLQGFPWGGNKIQRRGIPLRMIVNPTRSLLFEYAQS